jgi:hypothetical protein
MHDYKLFQRSGLPQCIPKESALYVDNGYQGIKRDYAGLQVFIPYKRHRGKKELTRGEKIFNKKQRRVRIMVENVLAKLKKFQVLNQVYRHAVHSYNDTFRLV